MQIEHVTVVGAGTMGHGIAQVAAQAGFQTTLYDIEITLADAALARVAENLESGIARGKLDASRKAATLDKLSASADLAAAVSRADLVIEAVPESMELKREVFAKVDTHAHDGCIHATNTSSLSITAIAEGMRHPERFVGMHFFNPVHIMKLLEIVVHERTSDETLSTVRSVGEAMGKRSIVVKDSPGFATSRLGVLLGLEAMRMLEQGVASAADIDTAMELGYRHPMGPLRLTDLVGLDVRLAIAEYLHEQLGSDAFEPPGILRELVAAGKLGKKSGRGFYDWGNATG